MKKSLLLSIIFCAITLISFAQTKPATTTKKTTTTTTTKKTTTPVKKPVAKPAAKTTVAKPVTVAPAVVQPVETPKEVAAPTPPVETVKEPSGPPVTGPLGDGPKSYQTEPATKGKTIGNTAKPAKATKTAAPKPEKIKHNNADDAVRSYIGIRGGYNLSTLQDINEGLDVDAPYLGGLMGGVLFNIGVSKSFSIQPEILYSQQGAELSAEGNYFRAKLDVINVPLLLKLAFGSPKVKFFVNAGPYIGYRISQTAETLQGGNKTSEKIEFEKEYDVNGEKDNIFDFGGIGGAGFQFNLGGPLLTLEGRYQYGMADPTLYKDGKPAEVGDKLHTRGITGTLGLLFPLGGK